MEFIKYLSNLIDNYLMVYVDKLLKRPNIKEGFQEITFDKIKKGKDFVLGMWGETAKRDIKPDGNWEKFRPIGEQQNEIFERMWCVSESACNAIETMFNFFVHQVNNEEADSTTQELVKIFKHFGLIVGDKCLLSTPYVAAGSGTTARGNNQKFVADFIRHYGLTPKGTWPEYRNWNQLYYPAGGVLINGNRVPKELLDRGKKLVEFVDIYYEWVIPTQFFSNYKYGLMQTSGHAWDYQKNGIYQYVSYPRNHAFVSDFKVPSYFGAFDSYNPFAKKLANNFNLGYGMLYTFKVKKPLTPFNAEEIQKLKARGWDYVLLVNDCGEYTPGAYRLLDDKLEKA
ncbi:MAG: hypothetical protein ABIH39_02895, partial [Candidatus Margulisiibacteriota bacterium]